MASLENWTKPISIWENITEQADWAIKWEAELIIEKLQSTKLVRMITISEFLDHEWI